MPLLVRIDQRVEALHRGSAFLHTKRTWIGPAVSLPYRGDQRGRGAATRLAPRRRWGRCRCFATIES